MAYNKVVLGDETVLDLTGDTVAADKLAEGYTAHDASGNQITGTMASGGAVESVNGKTGAVTLTAEDVSALPKAVTDVTSWQYIWDQGLYRSVGDVDGVPDLSNLLGNTDPCYGMVIGDSSNNVEIAFRRNSDKEPSVWHRYYMGSGYYTDWYKMYPVGASTEIAINEITDWNDAVDSGFYMSYGDAANAPYPDSYGTGTICGWVIPLGSGSQQFAFRDTQGSGEISNALYTRSINPNQRPAYYGEWQLVNKQTAADVPITAISGMTATTVQEALEENFQSVVDGKSSLETAITDKGGTVSKVGDVATFQELAAGVGTISGGGDNPPPQDGKTRLYVNLREGRTSPLLGVNPNGTVIVDWGDGTATDTLTGTSTSTTKWTPKHNYVAPGDYVITLTVTGTMAIAGKTGTNNGPTILRNSSSSDPLNIIYQKSVRAVVIGENVTKLGDYAFYKCSTLTNISIPNSVTSIGNYVFDDCSALTSITIPDNVTSIGSNICNGCTNLMTITLPDSVTSIGGSAFWGCENLPSISLPDGLTSIKSYFFSNCNNLLNISIPGGVTTIGASALTCPNVMYFDFGRHAGVPTLENVNAFSKLAEDAEIRVPMALVDEWKAATNWATYASQIVGV